jgi:hypothetical protein
MQVDLGNETRLKNSSFDVGHMERVDPADPDTFPMGEGRLTASNGAAEMKWVGDFSLCPKRRAYREDEDVILDVYHSSDGKTISGEIELSSREAHRLGLALVAHAEEINDG